MMKMMMTTLGRWWMFLLAGWTEQVKEGRWTLPETHRGSSQSAMKCTNVTGKAPLLIGSPSMWPSCEEGKQRRQEDDNRQLVGVYGRA